MATTAAPHPQRQRSAFPEFLMPWCLKAGSEVVAELGPPMPHSTPDSFSCPVRPTAAFERIRPVIEEYEAVRAEPIERIPASVRSIADPTECARATSEWIRANPGAQRRAEADRKLKALELSVFDDTETIVPFALIGVVILRLGHPTASVARELEDSGFSGAPPYYMLVALKHAPFSMTGA
ncbi:MAG TPA: hypothetical protein VFO66_15065 [Gemmatimonadaceae bacterium]|nr:hypothetical protein [Gemmatimonadaceae bacterium]